MQKEIIIRKTDKIKIELLISERGHCFCPVCGYEAENPEWRPYDQNGNGEFDICGSCSFQFGYNDNPNLLKKGWDKFRKIWLETEVESGFRWLEKEDELAEYNINLKKKKIDQLRNIGIYFS